MQLAAMVITATLLVFGCVLTIVTLELRGKIRSQIASRDAHILNNLAASLPFRLTKADELNEFAETAAPMPQEQAIVDPDFGVPFGPAESDVEALLQLERLRESAEQLRGLFAGRILAVNLFDADGLVLIPSERTTTSVVLDPKHVELLRRLEPLSFYRGAVTPQEVFGERYAKLTPSVKLPLLEVLVPIRSVDGKRLVGISQIYLDGSDIQKEYYALDRHLVQQGIAVFAVGGAGIAGALILAFRKLDRTNRLLAERTASLVKANTDLARSARAAAVGAVTAHLLHGLKNPVAGLQHYFSSLGQKTDPVDDALRDEAARITRRMQTMIREVARVLQEENGTTSYEVAVAELRDMVMAKAAQAALNRGVKVEFTKAPECALSNHQANLVMLILENLLANAIEATPPGKSVTVSVFHKDGEIVFEVIDQGPGVPQEIQSKLFSPLRSTKPDGLGMGLAISKQLADHLHAKLELHRTGPEGSVFVLAVPCGAPACAG